MIPFFPSDSGDYQLSSSPRRESPLVFSFLFFSCFFSSSLSPFLLTFSPFFFLYPLSVFAFLNFLFFLSNFLPSRKSRIFVWNYFEFHYSFLRDLYSNCFFKFHIFLSIRFTFFFIFYKSFFRSLPFLWFWLIFLFF